MCCRGLEQIQVFVQMHSIFLCLLLYARTVHLHMFRNEVGHEVLQLLTGVFLHLNPSLQVSLGVSFGT